MRCGIVRVWVSMSIASSLAAPTSYWAAAKFTKIRSRVASGLKGDVLEVGFGSGLNVPHYPTAVDRVLAVDPAVVGRQLAAGRVTASAVPVEYVGLDGASLSVDATTIDSVLVTWTLCTIPEVGAALEEMYRVLRPGGQLHFVEHGLSPELGVAKWQHRLTPLQRKVAGGCHLNRPIDQLIQQRWIHDDTVGHLPARWSKADGLHVRGTSNKALMGPVERIRSHEIGRSRHYALPYLLPRKRLVGRSRFTEVATLTALRGRSEICRWRLPSMSEST